MLYTSRLPLPAREEVTINFTLSLNGFGKALTLVSGKTVSRLSDVTAVVDVAVRAAGVQSSTSAAQFTVVEQPAPLITVILVTEPELRPLKTLLACGVPLFNL